MKDFRNLKKLLGAALALGVLGFTTQASASGNVGNLIINEWSAVGPSAMLQDCAPHSEGDIFFNCANGNGGNWIEFVVTQDGLDIRGWKVLWKNNDSGVHANNGSFKFSANNLVWSNLQAGTIITVRDNAGTTTDANDNPQSHPWDPCTSDDWWIGVDARDTTYITDLAWLHDANPLAGTQELKTDNDCWRGMIEDAGASPRLVQDWVGENSGCGSIPAATWAGSGVGNDEVGKLEANPAGGTSNTQYKDGDSSTYGGPNAWNNGGLQTQSLDALCNAACGARSTGCCNTSAGDKSCYLANVHPFYY